MVPEAKFAFDHGRNITEINWDLKKNNIYRLKPIWHTTAPYCLSRVQCVLRDVSDHNVTLLLLKEMNDW